jgi:hypothetical protein
MSRQGADKRGHPSKTVLCEKGHRLPHSRLASWSIGRVGVVVVVNVRVRARVGLRVRVRVRVR